jgi:FkbM family methyltransferase
MRVEREIEVKIGDHEYSIVSDDDYLEHIREGFEPGMVRLFRSLLNYNDFVFDIGSNIGCTSILFGALSKKVYSFEPSPTTCNFLRKNISRSGLNNIEVQNIGLGAEPGEFTLTFAPSNRSGGFVSNQTQASTGHTIENIYIRKVDDVVKSLNLPRLDFMKIDVEGFEWSVISGAKWTLSTYRPIVVLELNHWCLNAFQRTSIPDFLDNLRSIFPILFAVDGETYMNLHDESDSYIVMYHHILHFRFPNIVGAFSDKKLKDFFTLYQHRFIA